MKKMNKKLFITAASVLMLCFTACTKEVVGPAGPAGTQGPTGNANVQSSIIPTTTIAGYANSWVSQTSSGITAQVTVLPLPTITQDILSKGAVLVYYSNDNSTWFLLPLTLGASPSSNKTFTWTYSYSLNIVKIAVTASDGTDPGNPGVVYFKVVTVAGQ